MRKIALTIVLILVLAIPGSLLAVVHDYAADVQNQNGDASPGAEESNVNEYTFQDEQINLDVDSGVVKVLRTDQKINVNQFVTEFLQFKRAVPRELRHVLRTICRKEGGNADVLQDKVKKEYFMQVVCPEFQLPYLKEAARALDVSWLHVADDGDGNLYYKAKFRPIQDINWISQFYRGPEGYFYLDATNNALYYNDQPACIPLQEWGLKQIDIPPNQVRLDVTIYEVNTQNDAKLGLDWMDWKNGPGRYLFEWIVSSQHSHLRYISQPFGGQRTTTKVDIDNGYRYNSVLAVATTEFIDFLQVKGKARELVHTTLMAKSGHFAEATAFDRVVSINAVHPSEPKDDETIVRDTTYWTPYYYDVDKQPLESNNMVPPCDAGVDNLPQPHRRFLNFTQDGQVGVYVGMLPYIGLESMELELYVYASSVAGMDANGLPVIDERFVSSRVRLKDGEPFVVAGLKRKAVINRSAKVPILGSIPVLGWLFGSETDTNRENEVVVVIKPTFILGTDSDLELPEEARTIIALATGEEIIEIPKNSWGFDQWLLDVEK